MHLRVGEVPFSAIGPDGCDIHHLTEVIMAETNRSRCVRLCGADRSTSVSANVEIHAGCKMSVNNGLLFSCFEMQHVVVLRQGPHFLDGERGRIADNYTFVQEECRPCGASLLHLVITCTEGQRGFRRGYAQFSQAICSEDSQVNTRCPAAVIVVGPKQKHRHSLVHQRLAVGV